MIRNVTLGMLMAFMIIGCIGVVHTAARIEDEMRLRQAEQAIAEEKAAEQAKAVLEMLKVEREKAK